MNRHVESFCDGYAKVIELFPSREENIYTDWEKVGKDIEISIKTYKAEVDKSCQNQKKSKQIKKKRQKLSKY